MPNQNQHFFATNNTDAFDRATSMLVYQIAAMDIKIPAAQRNKMIDAVYTWRDAFKMPNVRTRLLSPQYERQRIEYGLYSQGFCGVISYVWYHMFRMPGGEAMWCVRHVFNTHPIPNHVWLENIINNSVLDLTFDQFALPDGEFLDYPYTMGTPFNANVVFQRGMDFAATLGIDLHEIVQQNISRSK